jgi:hypothetical protein
VGADIFGQIPLLDASRLIAGYKFALVWVDTHIIYYQSHTHESEAIEDEFNTWSRIVIGSMQVRSSTENH